MKNTKIAWCDHTTNLWIGCYKVHTGCRNCYAEELASRFTGQWGDVWGKDKSRYMTKNIFGKLSGLQNSAKKRNVKETVFIGSMMDIFEDRHDVFGRCLELFSYIENNIYPNLVFLFLTKRPENIFDYIIEKWKYAPPENVWIGLSVSDQSTVDNYLPIFFDNAKYFNTFLSIEPQIGEIKEINLNFIDWVIQGCESGNNRRPFDIEWARKMKAMCEDSGVPYFLKQIQDDNGNVIHDINLFPEDLQIQEFPEF